jgi:hypothetical protein
MRMPLNTTFLRGFTDKVDYILRKDDFKIYLCIASNRKAENGFIFLGGGVKSVFETAC